MHRSSGLRTNVLTSSSKGLLLWSSIYSPSSTGLEQPSHRVSCGCGYGVEWAHSCIPSCMWRSEVNLTCHSEYLWLSWNSLCQSGWPRTPRSPFGSGSTSWVLRLKVAMLGLEVILYVCLCACLCVGVHMARHVCGGQLAGVGV